MMELHNKTGDVTKLADNLTLKEVENMGFTIDLCDASFDPNEHWTTSKKEQDNKVRKEHSAK